MRVEQRLKTLANLGDDKHEVVAELGGEEVGLAGLNVGSGRLHHSGHVFLFVGRRKMSVIAQGDLNDEFLMARYR